MCNQVYLFIHSLYSGILIAFYILVSTLGPGHRVEKKIDKISAFTVLREKCRGT